MAAEVVSLGERLRQHREKMGLSQAQAARELDVARTAYRLWEMEAAKPAPDRWRLISRWLGVSVATMLLAEDLIDEDEASDAAITALFEGPGSSWDERGASTSGDLFAQERATIAEQTRAGALSPSDSTRLTDMLDRVQTAATSEDVDRWVSAELRKVLPSTPDAAALARAAMLVTAAGIGTDILADAELLTSELVTNAIVHAGGHEVGLAIHLGQDRLRVEVGDQGPGRIRPRGPDASGGWGLTFVAELSDRWGAGRADGGNVAWFELDLERHSRR